MKLEEQVCSLELAKRLKELGVKQESYFAWVKIRQFSGDFHALIPSPGTEEFRPNDYSAFTVAELGEMLPERISCESYLSGFVRRWTAWEKITPSQHCFHENTEADARAKMLIYLIENKLVKP